MTVTPNDIVRFWTDAGPEKWFRKDAAFDADIRMRFLGTHEDAAAGKLTSWEDTVEGTLALLILLDQFPRNMFRNDKRAFATDALARGVAQRAIAKGYDTKVDPKLRFFSICLSSIRRAWRIRSEESRSMKPPAIPTI